MSFSRSRSSLWGLGPAIWQFHLKGLVLGVLMLCASQGSAQNTTQPPQVQDFDWSTITPTETIQWSACYSTFKCTRFLVPVDYTQPNGDKFALAMIRVPAVVSQNSTAYKGPIFFNPGGPAASAIQLILTSGPAFQSAIGNDYDIVAFDPRGVGQTTPTLSPFSTRQQELTFASASNEALNASSASLGHLLGVARVGGGIVAAVPQIARLAQHVSTVEVARDILTVSEAFGREGVMYWGFSYGTVLGATFADMFPDKVERMILDGVADAPNYYATLWDSNLLDTDTSLTRFYTSCHTAGPALCPLWRPTVPQIAQRVDALLDRLKSEPLPFVTNSTPPQSGLLTYSIAKTILFDTLYAPHQIGSAVASALADADAGDAQPLYGVSTDAALAQLLDASCDAAANRVDVNPVNALAIACGDGAPVEPDLAQLRTYYERLARQSVFWDVWPVRLGCAGWKVQAVEKFKGNFTAKTKHPMLFISNTADPVTPISRARVMAAGFPGTVLLQQNSAGHTSTSAVSPCTLSFVRAYFREGTLPARGTVCQVESTTFPDPGASAGAPSNSSASAKAGLRATRRGVVDVDRYDVALLEAARALQRDPRPRRGGNVKFGPI